MAWTRRAIFSNALPRRPLTSTVLSKTSCAADKRNELFCIVGYANKAHRDIEGDGRNGFLRLRGLVSPRGT